MDAKPFVIPIFIPHAGCPHRCIFCNQHRTTGVESGLPSDGQIHAGIKEFLGYRKDRRRRTEISFYGGNFLGLPAETIHHLLGLAAVYVQNADADGIRFSTRPDTVDRQRLEIIDGYPVSTIEIGVQSMDDEVLRLNGRGHNAEATRQAVKWIRRRTACRLGLQLMIGMAGDSVTTALSGAEQLIALAPDFIRIYPMLVLKGSTLEQWYAHGRYRPLELEEAVDLTKILFKKFNAHGIPVTRMGLQPTTELSWQGGVVAGPFHPAFGELVRSAIWRDAIEAALTKRGCRNTPIRITVNPRNLSQVIGQANANVDYLRRTFHTGKVTIASDAAIALDGVVVNDVANRLTPQRCATED